MPPRIFLIVVDMFELTALGFDAADQRSKGWDRSGNAHPGPAGTVGKRLRDKQHAFGRIEAARNEEGNEYVVIAGNLNEWDATRREPLNDLGKGGVTRRFRHDHPVLFA